MKKKSFNSLKLNKIKVANLEITGSLIGATGGTCGAESNIICPEGDTGGDTGGGSGGQLTITCNWMCNPTQDACGITQVTCGCA
jgi:hypothetical protein